MEVYHDYIGYDKRTDVMEVTFEQSFIFPDGEQKK